MAEHNAAVYSRNTVILKNKDMEAWLYLLRPEQGRQEYEYSEIIDLLNKNGVRDGINESRITAMIKKGIYSREVLVAEGRSPVDGIDGYFEYSFDNNKKKTPAIREDGSVDYTSVNIITCVCSGDIIAMYHPAVKGKAGSNVKAKILQPKPARDLKPLLCLNVKYDPEGMIYRALIDGKVELTKIKISVVNLQEFQQSIDNVFGDVNFLGDVIIHGGVKPGVSINASKSVTIEGVLESSDVNAGGDVIVKGGVVGNNTTHIKAGGDVYADFIQYSSVEAAGSLSANIIMDSTVQVNGEVHATGKAGAIVGGNVYGMAGIDCIFAGNDVMLRTVVAAGVRDSIIQQKLSFERRIKFISEKLDQIDRQAEEYERNIRLGNTDDVIMKKKQDLMREKIERGMALNEAKAKLEEVAGKISGSAGAKIQVKDTIYNGSVVQLDDQQLAIDSDRRQVEFIKDQAGTLVVHPVIEW